ncbi:response regulator [Devosia sp.]|uniref:response regulator n=1 Tax=Devosia sp. TaxID=1871048 RepID=UPI002629CFAD|nr:response regulator [Devosia sp.]
MPQSLGTVLILEDEVLVSTMIEDLLLELGAEHALVCNTLAQARAAIEQHGVHCAILDVQIGGADSFEIADALAARSIPYFFASASGPDRLSERHRHRPLLAKPFSNEQLRECVRAAVLQAALPA